MRLLPAGEHQQLPLKTGGKRHSLFPPVLHPAARKVWLQKAQPNSHLQGEKYFLPGACPGRKYVSIYFPACGRGNADWQRSWMCPQQGAHPGPFYILPKFLLHYCAILVECKIFLPLQFLIDKPGERVYHGFNSLKQTTAMIRPVAPLCGSSERRRWVQVLSAVWCGESPLEAVRLKWCRVGRTGPRRYRDQVPHVGNLGGTAERRFVLILDGVALFFYL